ncbi:MAG: M15 family metallopeptidase [Desulfuromonadaceae bacterium]|nr:M15 family metallopeptidase [Desulfuromonadaceae bacterium]
MNQVLRVGSKGQDVKKWQFFLIGQGLLQGNADGVFGDQTFTATVTFQQKNKLDADGVVGHQTLVAAIQSGFVILDDTDDSSENGPNWPPRPDFQPITSNAERQKLFSKFSYQHDPQPDNYENIRILGNWEADNIVTVTIPQLAGISGAPKSGNIQVHRLVANQFTMLWQAWQNTDLLSRVRTYDGSYVPRFVRGSTSTLSNHAFGSAFDINVKWNNIGTLPALKEENGSVRELVQLANQHGFYWGGHYAKRPDGMHFEVAVIQS